MIGPELKKLMIGAVFASALGLSACGGGDPAPAAPATAPTPEVFITMARTVDRGRFDGLVPVLDNTPTTVILAVVNAGIPVRAIRCGALSAPRDGGIYTQALEPVLLLDASSDDVDRLKAFKFRVFDAIDQARGFTPGPCQRVDLP